MTRYNNCRGVDSYTYFRIASVRLRFLLSLGRWVAEALAEELLIWITGRCVLGAETLLAIPDPAPDVAVNGIDAVTEAVVVTGVAIVTVVDVATPIGYMLMFWVTSPSPVVDDTVEVPVVPELGDGCLKTEDRKRHYFLHGCRENRGIVGRRRSGNFDGLIGEVCTLGIHRSYGKSGEKNLRCEL